MRPALALLASVASIVAALTEAECERVPPEDFGQHGALAAPATPAGATGSGAAAEPSSPPLPLQRPALGNDGVTRAGAHDDPGRCVQATPLAPPPAVAAAPAPGCPADPEGGAGTLPTVRVAFPDASGVAVDAELVRSEHDTMRGLMYRKSLGAERGMLFDLSVRDDHKFWMHNTCIPLDLLYIDEDGLVVGIVENAPTLDDTSRGVGCPSRWVLEVNAGWSRRHGIKAGQRVKLP
jgi:uncharacterized membrane protein (UPF0127 family)